MNKKDIALFGGIDAGTTNTKVVFTTSDWEIVLSHDEPNCDIVVDPLNPLFASQPVADVLDGIFRCLKAAMSKLTQAGYSAQQIKGIAITGQMHSTAYRASGSDLSWPWSILWCDQRSAKQVAQMIEHFGPEGIVKLIANRPATGYSGLHYAWVKENLPEVFSSTEHFGLVVSYLAYRMTGQEALDWNNAGGTAMFDVAANSWSKEVLDWLGLTSEKLPKITQPGGLIGKTTGIESASGLPDGIPIFAGLGDCGAGSLGSGGTEEGIAYLNIATGCTWVVPSNSLIVDTAGRGRVQFYAYLPDDKGSVANYHILTTNLSAGSAIDQIGKMWRIESPAELDQLAKAIPFSSDAPVIDTRWKGDRTPTWKSDATARAYRLNAACNTPGHWHLATLKGIAGQMTIHLEVIRDLGVPINTVVITGGGSKSDIYTGTMVACIASQFPNVTFRKLVSGQASGARGMAILAALGAGEITAQDISAAARTGLVFEEVKPIPEWVDIMKNQYPEWRRYYDLQ